MISSRSVRNEKRTETHGMSLGNKYRTSKEQSAFTEKSVCFYETNDIADIKSFVYGNCIDGVDFEEGV